MSSGHPIVLLYDKYQAELKIVKYNIFTYVESRSSIPDHEKWVEDLESLVVEAERLQSLVDFCEGFFE